MALFTQFKQWIELTASGFSFTGGGDGNGLTTSEGNSLNRGVLNNLTTAEEDNFKGEGVYRTIGAYFERVSGGEPTYSVAEATPANSRGMLYRSTRWRISELTLEGNLTTDEFTAISRATRNFQRDGNGKFGVRRIIRDGEAGRLEYLYSGCSLISPISIDDGDVGRDNEVMMMRMRLQPEALIIMNADGEAIQRFDPFDTLDSGFYFAGAQDGGTEEGEGRQGAVTR